MEGLSREYTSLLLRREWLSETVFEVELERPEGFSFSAGQSIRVSVGGEGRDYSLAGGPSGEKLLLCVRLVAGGAVSTFLAGAALGAPLTFDGPHGVFTVRETRRPVVWAATGVGIAPFVSMVRAGASGFTLLHGARRPGDLFHREELASAASRYVPCLSREPEPGSFAGRVTEWAAQNLAPGAYDFSLCGSRQMVRDFMVLADERFPGSRIRTEIFF